MPVLKSQKPILFRPAWHPDSTAGRNGFRKDGQMMGLVTMTRLAWVAALFFLCGCAANVMNTSRIADASARLGAGQDACLAQIQDKKITTGHDAALCLAETRMQFTMDLGMKDDTIANAYTARVVSYGDRLDSGRIGSQDFIDGLQTANEDFSKQIVALYQAQMNVEASNTQARMALAQGLQNAARAYQANRSVMCTSNTLGMTTTTQCH